MAIRDILDCILMFDEAGTVRAVEAELECGTDIMVILNEGLIAAMDEVGRRYARGIFFVPEMLMSSQAMKEGMSALRPYMENSGIAPKGIVVIGTVKGDEHDIGKNLVAMMLEGAGFKVIDLGTDVEADKFAKAAQKNRADLIALSALLTTTLPSMEAIIARIKKEDSASKTLVGGAPVTQAFAHKIGADGYSPDASRAVAVARRLIGIRDGHDKS